MKIFFLVFILSLLSSFTFPQEIPNDRLEQLTRTLAQGGYSQEVTKLDYPEEYFPISQKYVNTENLKVRNSPKNGLVLRTIRRGDSVLIYDRQGEWEKISKEFEEPNWVNSQWLCSGYGCYNNLAQSNKIVYSTASYNKYKSKPVKESKVSTKISDGICPCSGSKNCIGPRGGIYCVTSGGNKRYR